ncbi:uncharacterized protein BXZ73DRAFT_102678 [Epithele typhae]|uniref:uncharacterized protein n=1 Tax=Epithele typhae TaxID=378194 RepID=UPI0020081ECD|nr:uncharacterized protein BXZ73DRAFT_102678 [Epithele typhae]KAH9927082.1 hypothetical protein BXZ73DRAFT_102678 [Epithele typhae]
MSSYASDDIVPGDIVAVSHSGGRKEGLVVGSHIDYAGRQIVEVQMEPGEIYHAWYVPAPALALPFAAPTLTTPRASHRYPTVTRVRRTVQYLPAAAHRKRTVERQIYW